MTLSASCGLFKSPPQPYVPKLLTTKVLNVYLDRSFNQGYRLPLDIAYVTQTQNVQELTKITPEDWFGKNKRDTWPFKQSLSVSPGQNSPLPVELQVPPDTQAMVVMANFFNLNSPKGHQVVFDAGSKEEEVLFVTDKGLFR